MKKNKEILSNINKELDQFNTGSFSSIKEKALATEKLPKEQLVEEKPTRRKVNWPLAIGIPVVACAAIVIPISISFANKPIAPCDASVETDFCDGENELAIRYSIKNNSVDKDSIKGIDFRGHIFAAAIKKLNYFNEIESVDYFIEKSLDFISSYSLLDSTPSMEHEVIRKDKDFVLDLSFESPISYIFMGYKSDYKNVEKVIGILDIGKRIFKGFQEYKDNEFTYENLLNYARNNKDFDEISNIYKLIDTYMPTNEFINDFENDLSIFLLNQSEQSSIFKSLTSALKQLISDPTIYEYLNNTDYNPDDFWFSLWDFEK